MADQLSAALLDRMAQWVLGIDGTLPDLELRLFVADIPGLDCETDITDFIECSAGGYAAEALVPGTWTGAVVTCISVNDYPQITFTLTDAGVPAETIYGHYVYDVTSGDWWWAGLWSTPFEIPGGGAPVKVTLSWKDQRCSG